MRASLILTFATLASAGASLARAAGERDVAAAIHSARIACEKGGKEDCALLVELPLVWLLEASDRPGDKEDARRVLAYLPQSGAKPAMIAASTGAMRLWIDAKTATSAFSQAERLGDRMLEPVVAFGMGLAEYKANHPEKAKRAFERFDQLTDMRAVKIAVVLAGSRRSMQPARERSAALQKEIAASAAKNKPKGKPCASAADCARGETCTTDRGACDRPPGCGPQDICADVCYGACVKK
jgi:hypothetical protein